MISALRRETGAALPAAIWVTLLLALLALGVSKLAVTTRLTPHSVHERKQAEYYAESAITVFLQRHLVNEVGDYVLNRTIDVLGQEIEVTIELEDTKIGLNKADQSLLSAVFAQYGYDTAAAEALADAVIDWRDRDDIVTGNGAEQAVYAANGQTGAPRNGPFETVGELAFVNGASAELVRCVSSVLTVYSRPDISDVDLVYASEAVKSVFRWAIQNNWHGLVWPDPDMASASSTPLQLPAQAATIYAREVGADGRVFAKVIRFKTVTSSETTYVDLTPLFAGAETVSCSAT